MQNLEQFERFTYGIFRIFKYWHKIAAVEMSRIGLSGAHLTYLLALRANEGGLTASSLCRICAKDKSDVSRALNTMTHLRFVEKVCAKDRCYGSAFMLTESGRAVADGIRAKVDLAVEHASRNLSEVQKESFYEVLDLISGNMADLCETGI